MLLALQPKRCSMFSSLWKVEQLECGKTTYTNDRANQQHLAPNNNWATFKALFVGSV